MADVNGNGNSITFTTKELLAALDKKLDAIIEKLDSKADKSAVAQLESRVQGLEVHGSPHLIEVNKDIGDLKIQVAAHEAERQAHMYLVETIKGDHSRIRSLEQLRWKILGALGLSTFLIPTGTFVVLHFL